MVRRTLRSLLTLPLMMAVAAGSLRGQDVSAQAGVDSTEYLIGDPIAVRVELRHPPGTAFRLLLGDTLGGFHVLARDSVRGEHPQRSAARVVFARYDSGRALLPPIAFRYRAPGDSLERTVETNPLLLTVRTVPVDTAADIRDIRPPLSLPLTLAEILPWLLGLLIVAAGVYAWQRFRRRRPAAAAAPAFVPPPLPAHVIALEELGELKEKRLWQQGLVKPYYSELTEILRRYFENRFRFMALEQTTDEIMTSLRLRPGTDAVHADTERVLRLADLVKFAKFQPAPAEHEAALQTAYAVVQSTAASAPPGAASREAPHVAA